MSKLYSRADVSVLTGMNPHTISTRISRNQLVNMGKEELGPLPPVVDGQISTASLDDLRNQPQDPSRREWNWYSALEVVQIAIQARAEQKLGLSGGVDPATAKLIAGEAIGAIHADKSKSGGADIWSGYASNDEGGGYVMGSMTEIDRLIQRRNEEDGKAPLRIVLVNVSEVIREVARRAVDAGIEFSFDEGADQPPAN